MIEKRHISKQHSFNLGGFACLVFAVFFTYYALLPCSIQAVLDHINHWARHCHVLAVALLPIYVALMVFGTAILGIYFGSILQRWAARFFKK
jgi:hypothetical protein